MSGHVAFVCSTQPLGAAQTRALTRQSLEDQLGRLGGTAYQLNALTLHTTGAPFAPLSVLNQVRREAVAALELQQAQAVSHQTYPAALRTLPNTPAAPATPQMHLLVRNHTQLDSAIPARPDSITLDFLDLYGIRGSVKRVLDAGVPVRVATPRLLKPDEGKILDFLRSLDCPILVRSAAMLERLQGVDLTGDFSLNTANSQTALAYLELGCQRLTPTHDLNARQIAALGRDIGAHRLEVTLYHHLPVFHTEHCVFCRFLSTGTTHLDCGRPCETHQIALRDERGRDHPVMADVGCRNTVFGAEAQQPGAHLDDWLQSGIVHFRVEFAQETAAQVERVTSICREAIEGRMEPSRFTAELRAAAPAGITEGSLTVPEFKVLA